ncbi:O-succinylbenzoate synthase [Enhygromyxa salina]|uniref:O-succinylbenzoate synthase n=1 Tax=Enhygromyxa salina TaxID=215803 RepID=A0A0C2CVX9_9BACT|nr:O-succinylbenzoate synthase [Enhygromyxa salina]
MLQLPFRERFVHALASRAAMASVWCRIEDANGVGVGWGEGCPRSYVTAELLEPSAAQLRSMAEHLRGHTLRSLDDITALLDELLPSAPSLRCAVEMALLDLLGRARGRSVAELLGASASRVRYSAVISAEQPAKVTQLARRGVALSFADYKLKVDAELEQNLARLDALREVIGPEPSVRVDANAAWSLTEAPAHIEALHARGVTLFEQPLPVVAGIPGHRQLRARIPAAAKLMVDESIVSWADLNTLLDARVVDRLLLKVSKQGGPLRCLAFARRAAAAGVPCHLGNHVGESSLLSAAGRVVAGAHAFETVEGSFGPLLLAADIVAEPLCFGAGGWAPVRYASAPGWGLDVMLDWDNL